MSFYKAIRGAIGDLAIALAPGAPLPEAYVPPSRQERQVKTTAPFCMQYVGGKCVVVVAEDRDLMFQPNSKVSTDQFLEAVTNGGAALEAIVKQQGQFKEQPVARPQLKKPRPAEAAEAWDATLTSLDGLPAQYTAPCQHVWLNVSNLGTPRGSKEMQCGKCGMREYAPMPAPVYGSPRQDYASQDKIRRLEEKVRQYEAAERAEKAAAAKPRTDVPDRAIIVE